METTEPSKNKSLRAVFSLSLQSIAYGFGVLGSQLIIYIMLPFLTHYMPQAQYGAVSVMTAIYTFMNNLTNAGLPSATFRFFNISPAEKDQRIIIGTSQLLFFLFAFIPSLGIILFSKQISIFLLSSAEYSSVLKLLALYLVVDSMNTFGNMVLRIDVRPVIASTHNIFLIICKMGLALLFVIVYKMGVFGYWLGFLTGESMGFLLMIWFIRKRITFQASIHTMWELMKFGFPLIPATLSMNFLRLSDRYIIGYLIGLEQVAVYDVGYKIGSIIVLLIAPFRTAWIPYAFSIADKPDSPKTFRDVLTYLTAGCTFLILGVIAFRADLVNFIAPKSYSGAMVIISLVAVSQLFLAVYHVFSVALLIKNRTYDLVWATLFAVATNLLINFTLIPRIGILGAAVATLGAYMVLAISTRYQGRNIFPIPIDWSRMGKLFLSGGIELILMFFIEIIPAGHVIIFGLKAFCLMAFPLILIAAGFISFAQSKEIFSVGKGIISKRMVKARGN